jgi:hypothetical protein
MSVVSRRLLGAACLLPMLAGALPLAAQTAARPADPLATIRDLYRSSNARKSEPFSRRLNGLFNAAIKRSRELNEPVEGLDFEYTINGQDYDTDTYKSVRISLLSQDDAKAKAKVTFRNGGPQELRYDLVLEGGKWLIDEVSSLGEQKWTLSEMYRRGAATPKS